MMKNVYSVGQVNTYIKNMFAQDFMMQRISVKGEVSNCKYHSSGHIYFTLKDAVGTIGAIMFAGNRRGLAFPMKEGDKVIVTGSIEVYERDGKYQLYAREIALDGAGNLYLKFEALKRELEEMGMFAPEYKKPIPKYIRRLGIVTAPTGAAVQDIRNIAKRRNPYVQLILYPALVQGDGAVNSIINGIHALDALGVDVIIVGRGGGSIEDLWAFNEECVARAIFDAATPIISAVGHETDFTIADFVADLRAPTPSAAAELAVPNISDILLKLQNYNLRYKNALKRKIEIMKLRYEKCMMNKVFKDPLQNIHEKYISLDMINKSLQNSINNKVQINKTKMVELITKLDSLSPLKTLTRGYSILEKDNKIVKSVKSLNINDEISIRLIDGNAKAKVIDIKE